MTDIICVKFAADAQVSDENPELFNRHARRVPSVTGASKKSENDLLDKGIKPLRRWEEGKGNKTTVAKVNHYFLLCNHYQDA